MTNVFDQRRLAYIQRIREWEIQTIENVLPPQSDILELGAGAGWQSNWLSRRGHSVSAIDINQHDKLTEIEEAAAWKTERYYPVQMYNGRTIPFPDQYFDVVFSSNVLEHVPHVQHLQQEIKRVLKDDGLAIHLLPTSSWRFWAILSHYPRLLTEKLGQLTEQATPSSLTQSEQLGNDQRINTTPFLKKIGNCLVPPVHGALGNCVSELYYFRKKRWVREFQQSGFNVSRMLMTGVFCTPYLNMLAIPGERWSKRLSQILGSSCSIFILHKDLS